MPEYRPPVDVETLLVQHFKADAGLTSVVPAGRISTELPKGFKREKRLQVVRIGGGQAEPGDPAGYLDAPLLQIMGYGDTRPEAYEVARTALASAMRAVGAPHAGAVVTDMQRVQGPYWVPDPLTGIPRYITGVILHVHPTAA